MKALAIILLSIIALSAKAQPPVLKLKDTKGNEYSVSELNKNRGTVVVFLSPTCPICQKYTLTLNTLNTAYSPLNIRFYGIIPGKEFTTADIDKFAKEYKLEMPMLLDPDYTFTQTVGATVTPEVILFRPDRTIQYSGKIDNWYESIGTRRTVITERYLSDAISDLLGKKPSKVKRTTPVGCFIF